TSVDDTTHATLQRNLHRLRRQLDLVDGVTTTICPYHSIAPPGKGYLHASVLRHPGHARRGRWTQRNARALGDKFASDGRGETPCREDGGWPARLRGPSRRHDGRRQLPLTHRR